MKATKSQRIAFQLVPRVRRTEGTGGGLLATLNTMDVLPPKTPKAVEREANVTRPGRTNFANLRDQLYHGMLLPTPNTPNGGRSLKNCEMTSPTVAYKNGKKRQVDLNAVLQMLPTPTVNGNHNRAGLSEKSGNGLATSLAMLSTPQARDYRSADKPTSSNFQRKQKKGWTIDLNSQIAMLPTTATRDYKGTNSDEHLAKERGHHDQLPNALKMNTGLKLQPAFAAWMMGFPEDWTLLPFLASNNTPPVAGEKNPSKPTETPSCPP